MNRREFFKRSGVACLLVSAGQSLAGLLRPRSKVKDLTVDLSKYVHLVEVHFPNGNSISIARYHKAIVHEGKTYEPMPLTLEVVKQGVVDLSFPFVPSDTSQLTNCLVCAKVINLEDYKSEIEVNAKVERVTIPIDGGKTTLRLRHIGM